MLLLKGINSNIGTVRSTVTYSKKINSKDPKKVTEKEMNFFDVKIVDTINAPITSLIAETDKAKKASIEWPDPKFVKSNLANWFKAMRDFGADSPEEQTAKLKYAAALLFYGQNLKTLLKTLNANATGLTAKTAEVEKYKALAMPLEKIFKDLAAIPVLSSSDKNMFFQMSRGCVTFNKNCGLLKTALAAVKKSNADYVKTCKQMVADNELFLKPFKDKKPTTEKAFVSYGKAYGKKVAKLKKK